MRHNWIYLLGSSPNTGEEPQFIMQLFSSWMVGTNVRTGRQEPLAAALLDDLEQAATGEIGYSASHLRFHDFLMKKLCSHYLSKEDRDRYCTLFDRSLTELRTKDKLEMAYMKNE